MAESDSSGEDLIVEKAANESDMDIAQCLPLGADSDYGFSEAVLSSDSETEVDGGESINMVKDGHQPDIGEELAIWATKNGCTRTALNEMLDILRRHGHCLPNDARTLLQNPRVVQTMAKCDGMYSYFGLESGILRNLSQTRFVCDDTSIKRSFNIDGVPLFKSTSLQFWPILCSFHCFDPFIVGLFCGSAKPDPVEEYLAEFNHELQQLCEHGVTHDNIHYSVSIEAFVCDAPARAFIKCIKGHSGYYSCERCTIQGSWNGRVVFNSDDSFPPRTQHDFDAMKYDINQVKRSPLLDVGISCVSQFSLDNMHLACLGVVKRMLCVLKRGPNNCRLSVRQKADMSQRLEALRGFMPREFARQPRSLYELDRWKAT